MPAWRSFVIASGCLLHLEMPSPEMNSGKKAKNCLQRFAAGLLLCFYKVTLVIHLYCLKLYRYMLQLFKIVYNKRETVILNGPVDS